MKKVVRLSILLVALLGAGGCFAAAAAPVPSQVASAQPTTSRELQLVPVETDDALPQGNVENLSFNGMTVLEAIHRLVSTQSHKVAIVVDVPQSKAGILRAVVSAVNVHGPFPTVLEKLAASSGFSYRFKDGVLTVVAQREFVIEAPSAQWQQALPAIVEAMGGTVVTTLRTDRTTRSLTVLASRGAQAALETYLAYVRAAIAQRTQDAQGLAAKEDELRQVREAAAAAQDRLRQANEAAASADRALTDYGMNAAKSFVAMKADFDAAQMQLAAREGDWRAVKDDVGRVEKALNDVNAQASRLGAERDSLKQAMEKALSQSKADADQIRSLNDKIASLQGQIRADQEAAAAFARQDAMLRDAHNVLKNRDAELADARQKLAAAETRLRDVSGSAQQGEREREALRGKLETVAQSLHDLTTRLSNAPSPAQPGDVQPATRSQAFVVMANPTVKNVDAYLDAQADALGLAKDPSPSSGKTPSWSFERGQHLADVLRKWTRRAGWKCDIAKDAQDYRFHSDKTFSGDLPKAIGQLNEMLEQRGIVLAADDGDRVIHARRK